MTAEHVRVLEPRSGGHRLWYVRLIADAAPDRCTLVTTADCLRSTEFTLHLGSSQLSTEVVDRVPGDGGRWFMAALAIAPQRRGAIIVPDAESALRHLLTARVHRPTAMTAVLMRMNRGVGPRGAVVFAAKLALAVVLRLRWGRRLRLIALLPAGSTRSPALRLAGVGMVHDPVRFQPWTTDPDAARRRLHLPAGMPIFSIVGPLSERKCVLEVIEAWTSADSPPGLLMLAGTATPEVVEAVDRAGPPSESCIVLRDQYVDDAQFDTYLTASDVAVLLYRNRGSSGVLGKALAADCDVLTSVRMPPVRAVDRHRVARLEELTPDRIRAALALWPGRRDRDVRATDDSASFSRVLLGGAD